MDETEVVRRGTKPHALGYVNKNPSSDLGF